MKNLNKVRTKEQRRVSRVVRFVSEEEMHLFILMYGNKFNKLMCNTASQPEIYGTIRKEEFDGIVKEYKLIKHTKSTKYWRTEATEE